ncbi:hypothetical protein ACQCN2_00960 [Brevibacillus ginsengisoli]|uniref:hypothetical protein n=1 Tax=Brevibacillus ginsengisoli TaxID=363854 RepID=UPI003CE84EE2
MVGNVVRVEKATDPSAWYAESVGTQDDFEIVEEFPDSFKVDNGLLILKDDCCFIFVCQNCEGHGLITFDKGFGEDHDSCEECAGEGQIEMTYKEFLESLQLAN